MTAALPPVGSSVPGDTEPDEAVVLLVIGQAQPVSALQLGPATGMSPATLYPALDRLEAVGRITAEWDRPADPATGPATGPRRRLYSIAGSV